MWNPSTIWNSVALTIAAAGLVLFAWALFADRAKGWLRCPKCWYSLDGTPADDAGLRKCPECGRGSLRERSLKRTRRRWRYTLLALLVLLFADQTSRVPDARYRGWVAFVPTTLIIPLAPIQSERWVRQTLGGADHLNDDRWAWLDTLREELFRRDREEDCWIWQGNVWADLAAWRPLGNATLVSKSFDASRFLSADRVQYSSRVVDRVREVQDLVEYAVQPASWTSFGGAEGTACSIGTRNWFVNSADVVSSVSQVLGRLVTPTQLEHAESAETVSLSTGGELAVFELFPNYWPATDDPDLLAQYEQMLIERLADRSEKDQWTHHGGDGIRADWFEGRLIVHGRTELVDVAKQKVADVVRELHSTIKQYEQQRMSEPSR